MQDTRTHHITEDSRRPALPINQNQNKKGEGLNFITVLTAVTFAGIAVFLLGHCGRTKTSYKTVP